MSAYSVLVTIGFAVASTLLVIAHHGDQHIVARFRRERARRIKAERDWAREAVDNIDLRDELAQTRAALATHVGHPSTGVRPLAPVIDFPRRGGA